MPKNNLKTHKNSQISLYSVHLPVIALIALVIVTASAATVVNDSTEEAPQVLAGKSEKGNSKDSKDKESKKNDTNLELVKNNLPKENKPVKSPSQKNSEENSLLKAAEIEKKNKNEALSTELVVIAEDVTETTTEVEEIVEEVESRNKWKTLLFGTDYKNLGQLRSQMSKNTNNIRKLTKALEKTDDPIAAAAIQAQIDELMVKQTEIKGIIEENEDQFSILGWVNKFLSGYKEDDGDSDTPESSESSQSTGSTDSIE